MIKKYINRPTQSEVLNTKLAILTNGIDVDFKKFEEKEIDLASHYRVNRIKVSDRHFIDPKHNARKYIPDELILEDNDESSISKVYYKQESKILLTIENDLLKLIDKETREKFKVHVAAVPLPNHSRFSYNSMALDEFVNMVGFDRISILPFDGCENWLDGNECKFCGADPDRIGFGNKKPNVLEISQKYNGNTRKWWASRRKEMLENFYISLETLLKTDEIKPHFHFMMISGNLNDTDYSWDIALEITEYLKPLLDLSKVDSHICLVPPPTIKKVEKAKELGFQNIAFNLECYGSEQFRKICPGKAKVYDFEGTVSALEYCKDIFGVGNVRTNLVLGAQPIEELQKGIKDLADRGIVTDYSIFFPRPGSCWSKKSIPNADEVLDFTENLVTLYKQYGYKPFCCSLSSRSSIANEVYHLKK